MKEDYQLLLIEDSEADAHLFKEYLEIYQSTAKDFYHLRDVRNLAEALEVLPTYAPHMIIADLTLPDSKGLDVVKTLVQAYNHIPIVVLTGDDSEAVGLEAVKIGAQEYLVKETFEAKELGRTLRFSLERKKYQERLVHVATHDPLTGMYNRSFFVEHNSILLERRSDKQMPMAVMFMDLDGFKKINDLHGHRIGDEVLIRVADRLKHVLFDGDILSRFGGDEFVISLINVQDVTQVFRVCEKILHLFRTPFVIDGNQLKLGASIGVALYPRDAENIHQLIQYADLAMYQAKSEGKNRYRAFSDQMKQDLYQYTRMETGVRRAMELAEFYIMLQPKYNVENKVIGAEALLRWKNDEVGEITPVEFIPVLEKSRLIIEMGIWVIEEVCATLALWRDQGLPLIPISINISPVQLEDVLFVRQVQGVLQRYEIDTRWIRFEVTESMAMANGETSLNMVKEFRKMGIKFEIDDFGTGYSSLSRLVELSVDSLKIDHSFLHKLDGSEKSMVVIRAIIELAKGLGLEVIAEGVETKKQLDFLYEHGCTLTQGFYHARPMLPRDLADRFLGNHELLGAEE